MFYFDKMCHLVQNLAGNNEQITTRGAAASRKELHQRIIADEIALGKTHNDPF